MLNLCLVSLIIIASASALNFNCQFVDVTWMGIGAHYQCQTKPSKPSNVETQYVTGVSGIHTSNRTNNDVDAIHISNCTNLSYIPKGLLSIFPNLIGIYLDGCDITSLNGTELNEYPQLRLFALELSPLQYVPGNLFSHNPDIFFVSFTDNKISAIGRDLLSSLNKLSEAYFENNTCINANATTIQEVPAFNEKLIRECSLASEMCKSVALTVLLGAVAYFGKYIWMN